MNIDLLNYINQARKSGMADEQIRQGLLQSGWVMNDVNEALMNAPAAITQQPKPKAMMSKSLAITSIVISLVVAGYFAGAYYMANYQSLPLWPFEAEVPVPTFTPRPSPAHSTGSTGSPQASSGQSLDFARDWQTYRNEEYGFEFKYPGDWIAEKLDNANLSSDEIISLREQGDDGGFGSITITRQNKIINESEFLTGLKLLNKSEVAYNNISWKILITADDREESLQFIDVSTYKNNFTHSLGGRYYQNREVFYNQILSTFKFIQ